MTDGLRNFCHFGTKKRGVYCLQKVKIVLYIVSMEQPPKNMPKKINVCVPLSASKY